MHRVAFKAACALVLPACALSTLGALGPAPAGAAPAATASVELPRHWPEGLGRSATPLRPLALGAVEQRFARGFPGQIARLTDGRRLLVWRHVTQPTRMLHPAADCYRAAGWRITDERLEATTDDRHRQPAGLQRCFTATQGGQTLRVCEYIVDAQGRRFTDTSAWFWAALAQRTAGPWQAFTVVQPS